MRFLIDECCAKSLARIAHEAGFEAYHVAERGLTGRLDHQLQAIILKDEFIFVTNNAGDFIRIYTKMPMHPGLIILRPNVSRAEQRELFRRVLKEIDKRRLTDLINLAIEVDSKTLRVYHLSAD